MCANLNTSSVENNSSSQNGLMNSNSNWISTSQDNLSNYKSNWICSPTSCLNSDLSLNDNLNNQFLNRQLANTLFSNDNDLKFEVYDSTNSFLCENGYPYTLRCSDNFLLPITKSTRDVLELWDKAGTAEEFFISGDLVSNINCDDVIAISEKSIAMIAHKFIDMVVDDPGMSKNFFHILCNTKYFDHLVVEEAFTKHWINRFQNFSFSSSEARLVQKLLKIISEKRGV